MAVVALAAAATVAAAVQPAVHRLQRIKSIRYIQKSPDNENFNSINSISISQAYRERERERDRSVPNIHELSTRTVTMSRDQQDGHGFGICVKGGKDAGKYNLNNE